jgi:cysteine desulfurase/selenocysteine lyase
MYDVYEIRKQFPMLQGKKTMSGKPLVFLDNASTTFKPQSVIDEVVKYYSDETANAHRGDYDLCYKMDQEVARARNTVADFINGKSKEIIFTSGTSMSINLIAYGYGTKFLTKDDEILLTEAEHASNVLPWFRVQELTGCKISFIPLDKDGKLTVENLKKTISKKTKMVCVAHVGNVLGYIAPIKELAEVAHEFGALIAVDGAQSVPHIKTNVKELGIDFLSFSGHKMCGPTGVGVLWGKYELLDKMEPFLSGGGMNAKFDMCGSVEYLTPPSKFEAGTMNLAGILGLRAAIDFINSIGVENIHEHESRLREYFMEQAKDIKDLIIYNEHGDTGIVTFNIKNNFAQDEATLLNSKGIAVRSGEHCAKILIDFLGTVATCRMSTYLYTTKEDIDTFLSALRDGGDILDAYFD